MWKRATATAIAFICAGMLISGDLSAYQRPRRDEGRKSPELDEAIDTAKTSAEIGVPSETTPASPDAEAGTGEKNSLKPSVPRAMTLEDCVKAALARNVRLRASGYDVEAAKGQLIEAKAAFWPVLEYNYRIAPVPTDVNDAFQKFFEWQVTLFNSFHVGIGIPVVTFGQLHTAKHMAEGGVRAAQWSEAKMRETTIFQVTQLYYGTMLAKEIIKLLEDASTKLGDKISSEETKGEKGIDPYDLQQLKLADIDLERRLDEAKSNLELAEEGLRLQMDMEPGATLDLDSDQLRPVVAELSPVEGYVDAAMESQPDANLIGIGVETKQSLYRLEKFKLMPHVGIGAFADVGRTTGFVKGITANGDFNNPFNYSRAGVGLQLKGTLDFHGAYGRIKKARAEYYKASMEGMYGHRAIALDVKKAWLTAKRAGEDVRRGKRAASLSRQMMFLSKANNDLGIGDNQKYGDSLKTYLLMRGAYFKAIFDYNIALADLAQKVSLAGYEQLTKSSGVGEYDAFDDAGTDEGFQTYGVEGEKDHTTGDAPSEEKRDEEKVE